MTDGMIGVGVAHAPVDGMTSETAGVTAALVAVTGVAGILQNHKCLQLLLAADLSSRSLVLSTVKMMLLKLQL